MDNVMAQLESLEVRYEEIQEMMADPEVIADTKRYMEITKEEADMREVVQKFRKFKADKEEIAGNKEIIADGSDPELVEMAKMENSELEDEISQLEDEIKILMLPKDPNDDKDIIMEIRGQPAGMKLPCSRATCCGCMKSTRKTRAGTFLSSTANKLKLAATSG